MRAELAAVVQQSAQAPALPASPPATGASEFDVLKFLEMSEATDEVVGAFKTQMLEQYELMKKRASSTT